MCKLREAEAMVIFDTFYVVWWKVCYDFTISRAIGFSITLVSLVLSASLSRDKQGQYHNGSFNRRIQVETIMICIRGSIGMGELPSSAVYWRGFEDGPRPSISVVATYKHEVPPVCLSQTLLIIS